jgi:hypothetical protein
MCSGKIFQRGDKGLPALKSDENVNFSHLTSEVDIFHQGQINFTTTFPLLCAPK